MVRIKYRKYPEFIKTSEQRHLIYNKQTEDIAEREKNGEHFVIRPPEPLNIKRASKDPDELERVYRIGRREMTSRLAELICYLK
jgi:predicted patatin/cPLA2 family phospholipase